MTDQTPSGNRWEPTDATPDVPQLPEDPRPIPPAEPVAPATPAGRWSRPRLIGAASAAGLALFLGGAGAGFALGQHHGADGAGSGIPGRGFDPDGDHRGFGQPGGQPGRPDGLPGGQQGSQSAPGTSGGSTS